MDRSKKYDNLGEMVAISGCNSDELDNILLDYKDIWIASYNSNKSFAVGGKHSSINQILTRCKKEGLFCKKVRVTNAFHTPLMDIMKLQFINYIKSINIINNKRDINIYSTVIGDKIENITSEYLWENIRRPVLFSKTINTIKSDFKDILFLEISSHPVLQSYIKSDDGIVLSINHLKKKISRCLLIYT